MTIRSLRPTLLMSIFAVLLIVHNTAFAHSALTSSLPGDGQRVATPPGLILNFNGPVSLLKLSIVGKDGKVAIDFTPSSDSSERHEVALPALSDGNYTVDWTILGADGHTVNKTFIFTVDATAEMAGMTETATHGHE